MSIEKIKQTLMNNAPKDEIQLHKYIKEFLGFHIAREKVCEHHRSPFEFVSDMFFGKGEDNKLILASRDSGKTQTVAIVNALNVKFKPGIESAIVGAIKDQAQKCYSYLQEFHEDNFLSNEVISSIMEMSKYKNKSKVEIVIGTATGVNSPHPNIVFWDEVDLTIWRILQQGFSMPHASDEYKSQLILDSTRKDSEISTGSMQKIIDSINDGTLPFWEMYTWCIWEIIERCKFPTCEQCEKIIRWNEEGEPETFASICEGKAKISDGHYKITEVWKKFTTLDVVVFDSEWLCRRPGRSGRMFPMYNEDVQVIDYESNPNLPVDASQEFGLSNPIHSIFAQIDSSDNVYVFDELVETQKTAEELCSEFGAWTRYNQKYKPRVWCCDPENPSDRQTMRNHKIPEKPVKCGIYESTQLVRRLLRPPSSPRPKLYISKKCKVLRTELLNWIKKKNSEEGEDKNNHGISALRYLCWYRFGGCNPENYPSMVTPGDLDGQIKEEETKYEKFPNGFKKQNNKEEYNNDKDFPQGLKKNMPIMLI